jgi:hypothetical protein
LSPSVDRPAIGGLTEVVTESTTVTAFNTLTGSARIVGSDGAATRASTVEGDMHSSSSNRTILIAGILAGLLLLAIVGILVWILLRRRGSSSKSESVAPELELEHDSVSFESSIATLDSFVLYENPQSFPGEDGHLFEQEMEEALPSTPRFKY